VRERSDRFSKPTFTVDIRVLTEDDGAAWWSIRRESLERDPLAFGKALEEHQASTIEAAESRFRDVAEGSFHLGAFEDATLIGMATFIRETGLKERHKGHIYGVYVSPAHRRKGVARALISALLEKAANDPSVEQILLSVATNQNAAVGLYRSFGFQTYGTERNALKTGTTYVDEDHMVFFVQQERARPDLTNLDHVQLAIPRNGEDRARQFYIDILGFEEVPKPPELAKRGGVWFRNGTVKLHLGVDAEFVAAKKAHPALRCDEYDAFLVKLAEHNITAIPDPLPFEGRPHCYISDPFCNRIEIIG
jgi:ribosomal protein S18 acetylase RimI-like enzyme/catechol 2,3-dioxygenase-like lactoylglutathione lyase family enzyme